jgi:hypothetical protein
MKNIIALVDTNIPLDSFLDNVRKALLLKYYEFV